ncbi:CidA/LrgA family protein [Sunxiuqinia sp. sy24]|uniref:CidA/LrgA family protein n=1 Tax=Sunxiuqinia sp. sy24 TaxID=3461495 RepID=UPI004045AF58
MKVFKQLLILLGINFMGELLSHYLRLPIPGSITGMILLLVLLFAGVIKERQIAETADFFMKNMGFFFIPAGVGVMVSYQSLEGRYVQTIVTILASTLIVMACASLVTQFLIKRRKNHDEISD